MSWRDRLRTASYRGVEFFVEAHEYNFGRRQENHEFPYRQSNYAEDLGGKTPGFRIEGFLVGDNYDFQRNILIKALKEEGPGRLVHPYLGEFDASVLNATVTEDKNTQGYCKLSMQFIASGLKNFPQGLVDPQSTLGELTAEIRSVNNSVFDEAFTIAGLPLDAVNQVGDTIDYFSFITGGFGVAGIARLDRIIRELTNRSTRILLTPQRTRMLINNALDSLQSSITNSRIRFESFFGVAMESSVRMSEFPTSYSEESQKSQYAVNNIFKINSLAIAIDAANEIEFRSSNEQLVIRNRFLELITSIENSQLLTANGMLLVDLDIELRKLLNVLKEILLLRFPPFNENQIVERVVVYDRTINAISALYEDAGNIDNLDLFITDNEINNPLFIPARKELRVSEGFESGSEDVGSI